MLPADGAPNQSWNMLLTVMKAAKRFQGEARFSVLMTSVLVVESCSLLEQLGPCTKRQGPVQ